MPAKLLALGVLLAAAHPAPAADKELAAKAHAILKTHCYRCHGQDGSVEGALNYVADLGKLVARKKVIPGNAAASRLFKRIDDETMPPPGEKPRPSPEELALLKKWIDDGAFVPDTVAPRTAISAEDVTTLILADLEGMDRRSRRFQRYFTLTHLHNAGLGDEELQTYRNALAKLVNSLSWGSKISLPLPVDAAKTVLRIDLRWFVWDATTWNRVVAEYPYGALDDAIASRAVMVHTAAKLPAVRADWFVGTASRAPLYYDVLQIPANLNELERLIRVDAVANVQQERVMRAGFNGSGVSRFNRILERHDAAHGMYWRSYDFDEPPANLTERTNGNLLPDRRNIFAFPLGPGLVETPFQHAGGEAIFALPNGLHAYIIMKSDNTRIDKGPVAVVSDPKRPDRAVEAGVSCMSCHVTGIIPKADQIRDHLDKNPKSFSRTDADTIRALYPGKDKVLAAMEEDGKRYAEAVAKTGAKVARYEAVSTITIKYEADIDLGLAAAEVGLKPEAFRDRINASDSLTKLVGGLRTPGGTISRQLWVQAFPDLVRELGLGTPFTPVLVGAATADNTGELDPLDNRDAAANAITFTADGKRALVASSDRSVRVYDVEGRRDLRRFVGHTASVWAVAFSTDSRLAISGSTDGTARVWDAGTGQEVRRFNGHTGLVSAVAFAFDNKWGVSGGFDGSLVMWKVGSGDEVWRVDGLGAVAGIAVNAKVGQIAVGVGKSVKLFDLKTGNVVSTIASDHGRVSAVAFTPDGEDVVFGTETGTVVVGNCAVGPTRIMTGHVGTVRSVAARDGRWVLSAGSDRSVKLWDAASEKDVAEFRKHAAGVVSAAFLANGTQTISGDRDLNVLPWKIDKFFTAAPVNPPVVPKVPDKIPVAKP